MSRMVIYIKMIKVISIFTFFLLKWARNVQKVLILSFILNLLLKSTFSFRKHQIKNININYGLMGQFLWLKKYEVNVF